MAILRGMDGEFYDVPEEQANKFKVPEEKVQERLTAASYALPVPDPAPPPPEAEVMPHHHWHNHHWHNHHWHNHHWHNHHWHDHH